MALKKTPIRVARPYMKPGVGLFGSSGKAGLFNTNDYKKRVQKSMDDFGQFDFGDTAVIPGQDNIFKPPKRRKARL